MATACSILPTSYIRPNAEVWIIFVKQSSSSWIVNISPSTEWFSPVGLVAVSFIVGRLVVSFSHLHSWLHHVFSILSKALLVSHFLVYNLMSIGGNCLIHPPFVLHQTQSRRMKNFSEAIYVKAEPRMFHQVPSGLVQLISCCLFCRSQACSFARPICIHDCTTPTASSPKPSLYLTFLSIT